MELFGNAMAAIMLGTGAFLTVRLGFFQFTHLGRALSSVFRKERKAEGVTPFQAMATALGGSVGTANIAGVAGAIAIGGPGAVFWMWAAGLLGMATKLTEIILALKFREGRKGGAMYYIERGMGQEYRPLARAFSFFGGLAALVGTALVQSNTVARAALETARGLGLGFPETGVLAVSGAALALLTGAVISGGAKRIGRFSEAAVPAMAALYALAALAVIFLNRARLFSAFVSIVRGAFGLRPFAGGAAGYGFLRAFRVGVARGVYSNEAGVGSAPMAHAGSSERDPVKQGLLGIFEVFADTIVTCTLTALVVLTGGFSPLGGEASGMRIAAEAFASGLGSEAASLFLAVSVSLFAFTSLTGWELYGERCVNYLGGGRLVRPYRAVFLLLIPLGALSSSSLAWRLGELFNYLMALPNIIALIALSGTAAGEVKRFKMQEK